MEHENLNNPQAANSDLGAVSGSCLCDKCGKEFQPYKWTEDCESCNGDGEYEFEMEWEYEPTMHQCPFCKGHGSFTWEEKKTCKSCKEYYTYEYDKDDEDYYCEHCGRSCNCH